MMTSQPVFCLFLLVPIALAFAPSPPKPDYNANPLLCPGPQGDWPGLWQVGPVHLVYPGPEQITTCGEVGEFCAPPYNQSSFYIGGDCFYMCSHGTSYPPQLSGQYWNATSMIFCVPKGESPLECPQALPTNDTVDRKPGYTGLFQIGEATDYFFGGENQSPNGQNGGKIWTAYDCDGSSYPWELYIPSSLFYGFQQDYACLYYNDPTARVFREMASALYFNATHYITCVVRGPNPLFCPPGWDPTTSGYTGLIPLGEPVPHYNAPFFPSPILECYQTGNDANGNPAVNWDFCCSECIDPVYIFENPESCPPMLSGAYYNATHVLNCVPRGANPLICPISSSYNDPTGYPGLYAITEPLPYTNTLQGPFYYGAANMGYECYFPENAYSFQYCSTPLNNTGPPMPPGTYYNATHYVECVPIGINPLVCPTIDTYDAYSGLYQVGEPTLYKNSLKGPFTYVDGDSLKYFNNYCYYAGAQFMNRSGWPNELELSAFSCWCNTNGISSECVPQISGAYYNATHQISCIPRGQPELTCPAPLTQVGDAISSFNNTFYLSRNGCSWECYLGGGSEEWCCSNFGTSGGSIPGKYYNATHFIECTWSGTNYLEN